MAMTPEYWAQIKAIFFDALDLPADERAAFVEHACGEDSALRQQVQVLLDQHDQDDERAWDSVHAVRAEALGISDEEPESLSLIGRDVGQYTIVERIGEGGMGVVFRARQHQPDRDVAIKLVRTATASPAMLRRFRFEAQVLGRLQHVGIAQIYEYGTHDVGAGVQPFFAMELVEGKPLLEAATIRKLSVHDRLRLMRQVCDAVSHAHQKGVMHRDLKPANVLVTADDLPKILDFGIARLIEHEDSATVQTSAGQVIGTMQYMSPEQIETPTEVDVRSDVYALGATMYELLCGQPPFMLEDLSPLTALQKVRDSEPSALGSVDPTLRGDVDVLVATAMHRERDRRYQSVADLARDIDHLLEGRPLEARADSRWYVFRRELVRHRVTVAVAVAFLVLLVGATIVSYGLFLQSEEARKRTTKSAEFATTYVIRLLQETIQPETGSMPSRESLDDAVIFLDQALIESWTDEVDVRTRVGLGYIKRGEYERAEQELRAALIKRLQHQGTADEALAANHHSLARALYWTSQLEDSLEAYEEALRIRRTLYDSDHRLIADSLSGCASCYRRLGQLGRAETLAGEVLNMRKALDMDSFWIAASLNNLATCFRTQGRFIEAESLYREAMNLIEPLDVNPIFKIRSTRTIAACLAQTDRVPEALDLLDEAHASYKQLGQIEHPDMAVCLWQMASCRFQLGDVDTSARYCREAIAIQEHHFGTRHWALSDSMALLARIQFAQGDLDGAWETAETVIEDRQVLYDDHHHEVGAMLVLQGEIAIGRDDIALASTLLAQARPMVEVELAPNHPVRRRVSDLQAVIASASEGR